MRTITIGVDLAKQVFSVCAADAAGRIQERRELRREAFIQWLPSVPEGTVVAMEACRGALHWARRCQDYGLQPRLIAAQFVAPFRKSRTAKNDRNDAEAIATAARQGNMRFVPIKSVDQQIRLSWHRVREGYKAEALATSNRVRGLLAEVGVTPQKIDEMLAKGEPQWVKVRTLPVRFVYWMATVLPDGTIRLHPDVYDMVDERAPTGA